MEIPLYRYPSFGAEPRREMAKSPFLRNESFAKFGNLTSTIHSTSEPNASSGPAAGQAVA